MLKFRLIARLDIKGADLIKTVRLEGTRKVGDPAEFARRYDAQGIDELVYLDVVASLYRRNGLLGLLRATAETAFVPFVAAGGIRCRSCVRELLQAGADKIALNTAALARPDLIDELAAKFGSSTIAVQIDAKATGEGRWQAYVDGGREPSGRDAVAWAAEAAERGAGEILLTSIDFEGTRAGFDLRLVRAIADAVSIPVVASGGFGRPEHAVDAAHAGANGIAIAGCLHYRKVALEEIRGALRDAGIPVRPGP